MVYFHSGHRLWAAALDRVDEKFSDRALFGQDKDLLKLPWTIDFR